MRKNVTILAKNPFTAKVKTRLSQEIGVDAARGIYARLLYQTLFNLVLIPADDIRLTLNLYSHKDRDFFEEAFPGLEISPQASGDLGAKIQHALQQAFQNGAQQAIVIGSDLPSMNWGLLNQAFDQINEKSVVLGPTRDGGYYLIGMQNPGVNVFENIPWSSKTVLTSTLNKVRTAGYQASLLSEFQDIDHESDLRAWQAVLMKRRNQPYQRNKQERK